MIKMAAAAAVVVAVGAVSAQAIIRTLPERDEPRLGSTPGRTCSASTLPATPVEQEGLSPEAAEMRRQIVEAAVACDYERLEELALPGGFSHALGHGLDVGTPSRYWEKLEETGKGLRQRLAPEAYQRPLARLVAILNAPYSNVADELEGYEGEPAYQWPSTLTWRSFRHLDLAYSKEEIRQMVKSFKTMGGVYFGYRTQITADGDWTFFFAGD